MLEDCLYQGGLASPVGSGEEGPLPGFHIEGGVIQDIIVTVVHGQFFYRGRISGVDTPCIRQFHGDMGKLGRFFFFLQMFQPAEDSCLVALDMALLYASNTFVEYPFTSAHAFWGLGHGLAFAVKGVGGFFQMPLFFLVLIILKLLEITFPVFLLAPV